MEQGYRLSEVKKAEAFSGATVCVIDGLGWMPTRGHILRCFVLGSGEIVDFERGCLNPQQHPGVSPRAEEKTGKTALP
jgi:hypothetical protein